MVIEAAGIGAHPIAPAAEQAMQRQAGLFGGEIPERHLQGVVERQRRGPPVAAARPIDAVDQGDCLLVPDRRPDLVGEHRLDFDQVGQRLEQGLDEAESNLASGGNQFQRGDVDGVGAHLAVADDAVAGELKARYTELR